MPARLLQSSGGSSSSAEPPEAMQVDSDVVVILASLLCALICVVGLALVARCAWLRRSFAVATSSSVQPPQTNKGLKKRALRSLPKLSFEAAAAAGGRVAECPICLAEFEDGEEIRILPQCGHWFHVGCVDTWLGSHSSCPSCRQILVVPALPLPVPPSRCRQCGASSADEPTGAAAEGVKAREEGDVNTFLP